MKTLRFRGYSDDIFGEYNITGTEIDNCASCNPIQCIITADNNGLIITGQYGRFNSACWDIGISLSDDEKPAPDWAIRISFEDYSTVLEIDVPDNFLLSWFNNGKEVLRDD